MTEGGRFNNKQSRQKLEPFPRMERGFASLKPPFNQHLSQFRTTNVSIHFNVWYELSWKFRVHKRLLRHRCRTTGVSQNIQRDCIRGNTAKCPTTTYPTLTRIWLQATFRLTLQHSAKNSPLSSSNYIVRHWSYHTSSAIMACKEFLTKSTPLSRATRKH